MKCIISKDKVFKIIEWIVFIGFSIVAGWFASGVIEQFISQKTSFSQHEEKVTNYPVISIVRSQMAEVNLTNVKFTYSSKGMKHQHKLEIGENHFPNEKYNKTEKVILESIDLISHAHGSKAFRIIHATPILDKKRSYVKFFIYISQSLEKINNPFSDLGRKHL